MNFSRRHKPKWRLGFGLMALAAVLFFFVSSTRIVLNGSHSLPHNGYVMFTWPLVISRGGYIAAVPPEHYREALADLVMVKRVVGLPGDQIRHEDGALCIRETCFEPMKVGERIFAPLTAEGTIPPDQYAAFADAPDSLDSRYETVGFFSRSQIAAAGWPIPIPHWKDIKSWLDG